MIDNALDIARSAALEAGEAIRGFYQDEYTVRDKGEDNPLTDADLAADKILENRLRSAFPDFGWLSEETADTPERLDKTHVWIVDPLDGTREFTLGIPEFVVSIGLVIDGKATLGVLYNPIKDQLFTGVVGHGASLNGETIRVTTHQELDLHRPILSICNALNSSPRSLPPLRGTIGAPGQVARSSSSTRPARTRAPARTSTLPSTGTMPRTCSSRARFRAISTRSTSTTPSIALSQTDLARSRRDCMR